MSGRARESGSEREREREREIVSQSVGDQFMRWAPLMLRAPSVHVWRAGGPTLRRFPSS